MSTSKLTELALERKATEFPRLSKNSIAWFKEKIAEIKRPAAIIRDIAQIPRQNWVFLFYPS